MSGPELIIALAGIAGGTAVFMTPVFIVKNVLAHREKIAKIRQGMDITENALAPADAEALRREMAMLRETTTRFDMSFDAALARVEQRLDSLETVQEAPVFAQSERREYGTMVVEDAATVASVRR